MREVSELASLLRPHLNWNLSRLKFLSLFILALIKVRCLNLERVAEGFSGDAKTASCYMRIQRFLKEFPICYTDAAHFLLSFVGISGPFTICIDRTNWKLGNANINLLVLSINWYNTSIPILTKALEKRGNSNTAERIDLLNQFIDIFGIESIAQVVGDREFKGKEWLRYLKYKGIPFALRIPANTNVILSSHKSVKASRLFKIKTGQSDCRKKACTIWDGQQVWLSAFRSGRNGSLLFPVSILIRPLINTERDGKLKRFFKRLKAGGSTLKQRISLCLTD